MGSVADDDDDDFGGGDNDIMMMTTTMMMVVVVVVDGGHDNGDGDDDDDGGENYAAADDDVGGGRGGNADNDDAGDDDSPSPHSHKRARCCRFPPDSYVGLCLLAHAMRGGDHPPRSDQRSPTEGGPTGCGQQRLPRPAALGSRAPANDPRAWAAATRAFVYEKK